ncbi:MAG: DUF2813 domain-containing protein [Bacteroidetes bacterium]|nr:MAG: DUF2813 domain-containing protein [Bacteroidota bacterium]
MIEQVDIKQFKAIQSASLRFTELTAFIGNNGSGKSSVIEALQTLQQALREGLSAAFNQRWLGLENLRNIHSPAPRVEGARLFSQSLEIKVQGRWAKKSFCYEAHFNTLASGDLYVVPYESLLVDGASIFTTNVVDESGQAEVLVGPRATPTDEPFLATELLLADEEWQEEYPDLKAVFDFIAAWQFVVLSPEKLYFPSPRDYSRVAIRLSPGGENLADFFSRTLDDTEVVERILEKMRYVLPDLDFIGREEIQVQKQIYLFLQELQTERSLPSWLFSSGTLRILALLTLLNQQEVPPVVFIEEVENGLDPRTLNLLVEEFRSLVPEHQFVVTTHSPYFLDLVDLSHVVVTQRQGGKTTYHRPDDDARLDAWRKKFSPGRLYTMNKLERP